MVHRLIRPGPRSNYRPVFRRIREWHDHGHLQYKIFLLNIIVFLRIYTTNMPACEHEDAGLCEAVIMVKPVGYAVLSIKSCCSRVLNRPSLIAFKFHPYNLIARVSVAVSPSRKRCSHRSAQQQSEENCSDSLSVQAGPARVTSMQPASNGTKALSSRTPALQ